MENPVSLEVLLQQHDEGSMPLVDAMDDHMTSYDESLYFACKDYMEIHHLHHQQQKRAIEMTDLPLRYQLLTLWSRPLATTSGKIYFAFQALFATLSITQLLLETMPRYAVEVFPERQALWDALEIPTVAFFMVDLAVRMALLPSVPNDFSRLSRRKFARQIEFWVDVMTILPSIIQFVAAGVPWVPTIDFLKALRILRFTKVLRQFHAVDQLAYTLEKSAEPLMGPFIFLFGVLITMSGALYYAERGEYDPTTQTYLMDDCDCLMSAPRAMDAAYPCPMAVSKFRSIPHTMWFCLVTLSTVGYGDMVPRCWLGRFLATLCILCGNVLTAMPIAIVGTYFADIVVSNRKRQASDASKAFDRGTQSHMRLPNSETNKRVLSEMQPPGERLLDMLATNTTTCPLMSPPGVIVHHVNAFIKSEFDDIVAELATAPGIAAAKAARRTAVTPPGLHLTTSPANSTIPISASLVRPVAMTVGAAAGMLQYCIKGEDCEGLPLALMTATLCPVRHTVSITAAFPAIIKVNGQLVEYDNPTRLLVGDHVAVYRDTAEAPSLAYQFVKPSVPQRHMAPLADAASPIAAPAAAALDGAGGVIRLRVVEPMGDYRGLTFDAFAPVQRVHGTELDYSDL
jgi:hypothetical protein